MISFAAPGDMWKPNEGPTMQCGTVLSLLAARRYLASSPINAGERNGHPGGEERFAEWGVEHFEDAAGALEKAWLGLEIVLAGSRFLEEWQRTFSRGEAVARELRDLLDSVDAGPLDQGDPEAVGRSWRALLAAREDGFLAVEDRALADLVQAGPALGPFEEDAVAAVEAGDLDRLGEECERNGREALCPLLHLRWRGREPLVVALAAALLHHERNQEAEGAPELAPSGQARTTSEELLGVARVIERYGEELSRVLSRLRPREPGEPPPADAGESAAQLQAGLAFLRRGEYDRAIGLFNEVLASSPGCVEACLHRAEAWKHKGNHAQALASLDAARELAPDNPVVLFQRGMLLGLLGRAEEAIDEYTQALRLDPENALARTYRGSALLSTGKLKEAASDLTKALQRDPDCVPAYQTRGDVLVLQGRFDQAIADYTQALRRTPYCAENYLRRGNVYKLKREHDRAIADYSHALRLDPLHALGYVRRASAYRHTGQHDLALADLNAACRLDPDNERTLFQRGRTFRDLKDYRSALGDFDRALAINPSAENHFERGLTHEMNGDLASALQDFDAAVGIDPGSAGYFRTRGELLVRLGRVDEAIDNFSEAIRLNDQLARAYLDRARAWVEKGRLDNAVSDCTLALERDPRLTQAYLARGDAHLQQGDYPAADADFTEALASEPRNAHAYQGRAQASLAQGEYHRAVRDLERCLELAPANAQAFYLRGTVRQATDEPEAALADLNQAMLLDTRYTPAYCNQRAAVHLLRGEPEQALADYAIVLQLDPANVTALSGRDQARAALEAARLRQVPAANGARPNPAPTRKRAPRQRPAPQLTQELPAARLTQPQLPAVGNQAPDSAGDWTVQPEPTLGAQVEATQDAPLPVSEFLPDEGLPPPTAGNVIPFQRAAEETQEPPRPIGPMEQLAAREQRRQEMEDRARQWEEMRHRERQAAMGIREPEPVRFTGESDGGSLALLLKVCAVLVVLGALGGGGYFLFFQNREPKLTSQQAWDAFEKDPDSTYQKYKGKFVQVTGPIKLYPVGKTSRFFFEIPADAKWGIEFTLTQSQMKELKDGLTITVRGRFSARKNAESNVVMTNCNLLKVQ
jgi:tetratricopeptide (TPR) repeat protein